MPAMNIYSIYKATNNINGKVYIGFDSNWPRRKMEHKSHSKNKCETQTLHKAIKKYGWNNFEWEVIYQSLDRDYCLNKMESYFIEEYNSFKYGYNMTKGGEGTFGLKSWLGKKHSKETKLKISSSNKGKIKTEEHLRKISKAQTGKSKGFRTEIQKKKISDSLKGRKPTEMTPDIRKKISNSMRKKVFSEEHRRKTIENLPRGENHPSAKPVIIDGIRYGCKKDAMVKLNLTLRKVNSIASNLPQIGR